MRARTARGRQQGTSAASHLAPESNPAFEAALPLLYKILGLFKAWPLAATIVGASAPVVLTSRADSDETKFNSIALAAALS